MGQVKVWPKDEHAKDVVMNHGEEIKKLKAGGQTIPQLAAQFSVDPKVIRQVLHDYWPLWKLWDEELEAEDPKPTAKALEPAKADPVNHPAHYNQYSHEVIELTERCDFCLGNAFKYILRSPFKEHRAEDLDKSMWYVRRYVSRLNSLYQFSFERKEKYEELRAAVFPFVEDLINRKELALCVYFLGVFHLLDHKTSASASRILPDLQASAELAKEAP